jgi:hypothetical protein
MSEPLPPKYFVIDDHWIDGQWNRMVVLAKLEADFVGGEKNVMGRDFLADAMCSLKNARCQLTHSARSSFDNQVAITIQPDFARAVDCDSNTIGLCTWGQIQIVFQLSPMTVERDVHSRIEALNAGFGIRLELMVWPRRM